MNKFAALFAIMLGTAALSACDTAQEQLGLTKSPPDEFKVVKRAPLELPPQYTLRPPSPGAPRPQEQETVEQARQTVFGAADVAVQQEAPTTAEGALLQQAGAGSIDPEIRQRVDKESAEMVDENQPVIEKLMSIGSDDLPPASVLDASKESERLQKNQEQGKPVTEGETPSVDN